MVQSRPLVVLGAIAGVVRSQVTLPSCPRNDNGQCDFDPINRQKCGEGFFCFYENICLAEAAGYNINNDCCQAPQSASCSRIFQPQICGTSKKCPYANLCLAKLAGYSDNQCNAAEACTRDVKVCPTGEVLVRNPINNCEFPPCPDQTCPLDILRCPNGDFVSRNPERNCAFDPCISACNREIKQCPAPYDDVWVSRDPENGCEFYPCPRACTRDTNECGQARNPFDDCEFPGCPRGCSKDIKVCPDGEVLARDPLNNCRFPDCTFNLCPLDILECPDGTFVTRDPKNNCNFPPCPRIDNCPLDIEKCPGYDYYVGRDPENNCEFFPCPPLACPTDVNECGQARDPFSDPPCEFPGCAPPCPLPANIYSILRRHKWNKVCVPWGDTPFATSGATRVGTVEARNEELSDGGWLESSPTTVKATAEIIDANFIEMRTETAMTYTTSTSSTMPAVATMADDERNKPKLASSATVLALQTTANTASAARFRRGRNRRHRRKPRRKNA